MKLVASFVAIGVSGCGSQVFFNDTESTAGSELTDVTTTRTAGNGSRVSSDDLRSDDQLIAVASDLLPSASETWQIETLEDVPLRGVSVFSRLESDLGVSSAEVVQAPVFGSVDLNVEDGTFDYAPARDHFGSDLVLIVVCSLSLCSEAKLSRSFDEFSSIKIA
jgi:hypothetical protein